MTILSEFSALLRCPACVGQDKDAGHLTLFKESWLICQDCGRKYPIRNQIPVMLVVEGDKWQQIDAEALPDTAPESAVG